MGKSASCISFENLRICGHTCLSLLTLLAPRLALGSVRERLFEGIVLESDRAGHLFSSFGLHA